MSKVYVDKGRNDGDPVYSINLLSEKELQIITASLDSSIKGMSDYLINKVENSETRDFIKQQFEASVELLNKLNTKL